MRVQRALIIATAAVLLMLAPQRSEAFIHEIIAAMCNGLDEVIPPGQVKEGTSFLRALQATGFITAMEFDEDLNALVISFNPDIPASKFKSAGFDLTIEDGVAPGVDLILSPLPIPDEEFAAHAHCHHLVEALLKGK
jgi:hypothetical protein